MDGQEYTPPRALQATIQDLLLELGALRASFVAEAARTEQMRG